MSPGATGSGDAAIDVAMSRTRIEVGVGVGEMVGVGVGVAVAVAVCAAACFAGAPSETTVRTASIPTHAALAARFGRRNWW